MISLSEFTDILAGSLFDGDTNVAGIIIFTMVLATVFVLMRKNTFASLLIAIPIAFVFSLMGVLSADMAVILIVICVLGLATVSKKALGD